MSTKNFITTKLATLLNSNTAPSLNDKSTSFSPSASGFRGNERSSSNKPNFFSSKFFTFNKLFTIGFIALVVLGLFFWIRNFTSGFGGSASTSSNAQVAGATKQQDINKSFAFSIKDEKGVEVSKLNFLVENSELRDQIIIKGRRATAPSDKTFLVINLKITNDYNKNIQISTRDYMRLLRNNNEKELLAPEVHNDPVDVQATSTKFTRVAFVINKSDKDLKLRVGELDKEKTVIDLKL
jgi:hypothetical protein